MTKEDDWVKDTTSLAAQLNLSRETIYSARKRFADAPKKNPDGRRENIADWRKFCAEKLIGKTEASKNLSELKAELMQRDIDLRDLKIARERADVIDKEVVEEMLVVLGQKLDLLLRLKLEVELGPRVAGKNAAEANVEGALILDEIREVINSNISKFETDAVKQSQRADGSDE